MVGQILTTVRWLDLKIDTTGGAKDSVGGRQKCPTAYVVSTQLIQAGDITVNRSTYACPDNGLREAAQTPLPSSKKIPKQHFGRRGALEGRNAVECRNPAPECQCGQSCKFNLNVLL